MVKDTGSDYFSPLSNTGKEIRGFQAVIFLPFLLDVSNRDRPGPYLQDSGNSARTAMKPQGLHVRPVLLPFKSCQNQ